MDVPYKYTGKELDSTGLYYCEARYYDPQLGRFISPDTLVESLGNPQTLNRYSYVGNNPLRYTDPSGHCFVVCIHIGNPFKHIGKFFHRTFHLGGLNRLMEHNMGLRVLGWVMCPMCMQFIDPATRPYAVAGAAVAATVATGGAAMPALGPILGGALGGAVGGAISGLGSTLAGQQVDWGGVMLAGTIGGGLGGAVGLIGDPVLNMIGRGITGGVTSSLRGGNFGIGFAIGFGTAAAFQAYTAVTGFSSVRFGPGGGAVVKSEDGPAAFEFASNPGFANKTSDALAAAQGRFCCGAEGTGLMTAAGVVPGVNAMAGFHDFLTDANHLGMNVFTNVPTLLPSYALTLAAGMNQMTVGETTFSLTVPLLTQMKVQ